MARTWLVLFLSIIVVSMLPHATTLSAAEDTTNAIFISTAVPGDVNDYRVLVENGILFFSWESPLAMDSVLPSSKGSIQAMAEVYPGLVVVTFTASGNAEAGDASILFNISGSGEGGSIAGGSFSARATGAIESNSMTVSLEASLNADPNGFEISVKLEPSSPSSLPLFAVASGIASQTLRDLADRLESNGYIVELREDAGISSYTGVLTASTRGNSTDSVINQLAGFLGAGSPAAPLLISMVIAEPVLAVDEPLIVAEISASFTGGASASLQVSGSIYSEVAYFANAVYNTGESLASVELHGSPLLVNSLENAMCSAGLWDCDAASESPLVEGTYRAVEAAFTSEVLASGPLEITGWMKALKPFTVNMDKFRVTLPEGEEASQLGIDTDRAMVYGDFTRITVESSEAFAALGPGYTVEGEKEGDTYSAILVGPGSFILSPPESVRAEEPKPVTITLTETVTETKTVTTTVSETITTTVTLTLREAATQQGSNAEEGSVSLAALAGAALAVAAPLVAYLILVRSR